MKTYKFQTTVRSITAYPVPVVQTTKKGATVRLTHKIELNTTAQMKKVQEELAAFTNGNGNPIGLGIAKNNSVVLRITDNFAGVIAASCGVTVAQLPLVAPGTPITIEFEHREPGDIVINPRTKDEIEIENHQVAPLNPVLHLPESAKMQLLIAQSIAGQMLASFGMHAPAAVAAPAAATTDDDIIEDEAPEEAAAPAAPARATGRRTTAVGAKK